MKHRTGSTPKERESFWTKFIEEFMRSSDSVEAACAKKGVSKKSYYFWLSRLRPAHPEWSEQTNVTSGKRAAIQVKERAQRRRFSDKYKESILRETEAAPGRVASILRREGLYTSHLQKWREDSRKGSLEARQRGPKPNPAAEEILRLKRQLQRTERKLAQANALIDLQKKVAEILKTSMDASEEEL